MGKRGNRSRTKGRRGGSNRRNSRRSVRSSAGLIPNSIPQLNTSRSRVQTIRYQGAPTGLCVITRACLLSLIAANSTANSTVVVPINTSVKLRGLKIFLPGLLSSPTSQNFTMRWVSDTGQGGRLGFTNIGTQGFHSGFLRPPNKSRAADWSIAGAPAATLNEPLFDFDINSSDQTTFNVIIDLTIEMKTDSVQGATLTTVNMFPVVGIAYAALDNLSTTLSRGTGYFTPQLVDYIGAAYSARVGG